MMVSLPQLVEQVRSGGPAMERAAGRLMTLFEDQPQRLPELFQVLATQGGEQAAMPEPRLLLGITGAPGAGKSTLTDAMVAEYRQRFPDRRIGVIAVDPSSPFSGGAVLGDRVRMMRHATDPMVFVRSVATRGHLGGLSLGVKGVIRVMGLMGCDVVILETVGVGQSEVEVCRVADHVLVVLAPGQGDSIQLLKAGLMEIGDVFVVNKADREGAAELHYQLLQAMQLSPKANQACGHHAPVKRDAAKVSLLGASPEEADAIQDLSLSAQAGAKVALVSATHNEGVDKLVDIIETDAVQDEAQRHAKRRRGLQQEIRESILEAARQRLIAELAADHAVQQLLDGSAAVQTLAKDLLKRTAAAAAAEDVDTVSTASTGSDRDPNDPR